MKINKTIILLLIIWIVLLILAVLGYNYMTLAEVKEIPIYVVVGDNIGFNVSKTDLNFGIIPRPSEGDRRIMLFSAEKRKVSVFIEGNVKGIVLPDENNFVFAGNRTLRFVAIVDENTEFGNYSGKAVIVFRKAI